MPYTERDHPFDGWLEGKGGQPEGYCHRKILDIGARVLHALLPGRRMRLSTHIVKCGTLRYNRQDLPSRRLDIANGPLTSWH
ncbi:hypothetical protein GCM10010430_78080 [Kitasatospora cystarginea]|uniref:Uncharacterized protein n=1 Tax=Kitasatospora cystarginea TaxID=58350 RepID=A0ABP5RXS5_9ACTN